MSEEHDAWFKEGFGLDLGRSLQAIQDEPVDLAAAGSAAPAVHGIAAPPGDPSQIKGSGDQPVEVMKGHPVSYTGEDSGFDGGWVGGESWVGADQAALNDAGVGQPLQVSPDALGRAAERVSGGGDMLADGGGLLDGAGIGQPLQWDPAFNVDGGVEGASAGGAAGALPVAWVDSDQYALDNAGIGQPLMYPDALAELLDQDAAVAGGIAGGGPKASSTGSMTGQGAHYAGKPPSGSAAAAAAAASSSTGTAAAAGAGVGGAVE